MHAGDSNHSTCQCLKASKVKMRVILTSLICFVCHASEADVISSVEFEDGQDTRASKGRSIGPKPPFLTQMALKLDTVTVIRR